MRALVSCNRFINIAPKNIDKQKYAEYFGIFLSCITAVVANLVLLVLFAIESIYSLSLFSLLGAILWSFSAYLTRQGKFSAAIYIGLCDLTSRVAVITYVIGTDYGVQLILWSAIALVTLNSSQKRWVNNVIGIMVVSELALLYALLPGKTELRPFAGHEDLSFIFITVLTAIPLMFVLLRMKSIQIKQRKKLQNQIHKDELTNLYNRGFLYELLGYELEMMKQARSPFCLCFADIDHFKKVNDSFGHQIGDEVLVGIADVLTKSLRKSDVICRWGGEEFVIVLPRCPIETAPSVINKVVKTLKETQLSSEKLNITMSFGIVSLNNDEPLEHILKRADDLLYLAKSKGRNRIELEQED